MAEQNFELEKYGGSNAYYKKALKKLKDEMMSMTQEIAEWWATPLKKKKVVMKVTVL